MLPSGAAPTAGGVSLPAVHIEVPAEDSTRAVIDRLALFVAEEGHAFERVVMEREQNNPHYRFMFDASSADNLYYRWKVVSLCSGATEEVWDTSPMQLESDACPKWIPPPFRMLGAIS